MKNYLSKFVSRVFPVLALLVRSGTSGLPLVAGEGPRSQTGTLALVGAKIYASPEAQGIPNGVVLVRDGKIVAVGPMKKIRVPRGTPTSDPPILASVAVDFVSESLIRNTGIS